jgi:hypothetical protein
MKKKIIMILITCFAFTLFFSGTSFALGNGEFAFVARQGNQFKEEARIFLKKSNSSSPVPYRVKCKGLTFYFADYQKKKVNYWKSKGYTVFIEQQNNNKRIRFCTLN